MLSNKLTQTTFLISLVTHLLFLMTPLERPLSKSAPAEEFIAQIEIEKPSSPKATPMPEPEPEPVSLEPEPIVQETEPVVQEPVLRQVPENVLISPDTVFKPKQEPLPQQFARANPFEEEAARYKRAREGFLQLVRSKIEGAKYYPRWAREKGYEGIVKVELTIMYEGKVAEVKMVDSSGYEILDKAALATIKRASPFPKLPRDLGEKLNLTVPIVYRLVEE